MTVPVLVLTLAYAALAALLLNLNLATRHPARVKALVIILATGFYAASWYGYRGLTGWATPEPLPETFRVHWLMIEDPDKQRGSPGAIYFWVRELDTAGFAIGEPRAHRVPWSESAARDAESARARMEEGELLNGRLSRDMIADNAVEPAQDFAGDGGPPAAAEPGFEFSRVPPPALPPKGPPPGAGL
jgi:pimeloyl-ACP methyl ester carboxylesterase